MYRDLELFLHSYAGLVLVNLWEQGCEASLYMDQLMRELERFTRIPVLRLTLTEYRDWARAHGVYGTPALVAYYQGRPLFRLIGRATPAELLQRLRQYGVDPP
jgi:thiol-disulfide isomerase/thioredoxin